MRSNVRKMSSPMIDRKNLLWRHHVTDYRAESDVTLGFYSSVLEDDIFRTLEELERIESNQPYYTNNWRLHSF